MAASNEIATLAVLNSLRHSQFQVSFGLLDKVILSPHMHQAHHGAKMEHWDKNLGNKLSIWNWCFLTGFKPGKGEILLYGTGHAEDADYESVLSCYILPAVKAYRLASRWENVRGSASAVTQALASGPSTGLSRLQQTGSFMDQTG